MPRVDSSPTDSSATRGRATPWTTFASAEPMNANWTRCSARTSVLAPTSTSVTGAPGTGICAASAGRRMPRSRLMLKSPAASAAPVAPADTSASASPSATACAARTIEESRCERAAAAGLAALAIDSGASMTSMPGPALPISAAGPNSSTRTPCRAARLAPSATSAGPRSAPLASTATIGSRVGAAAWSPAFVRLIRGLSRQDGIRRRRLPRGPRRAERGRPAGPSGRDRGRAPRARRLRSPCSCRSSRRRDAVGGARDTSGHAL